jgi:hypothetical protein
MVLKIYIWEVRQRDKHPTGFIVGPCGGGQRCHSSIHKEYYKIIKRLPIFIRQHEIDDSIKLNVWDSANEMLNDDKINISKRARGLLVVKM